MPRPPKKKDAQSIIRPIEPNKIFTPEAGDKSKPLRRLWQMLTILEESPDGLTISELSLRLQTSTRTVRRYLECVEDILGGDFETAKKIGEERRFMLSRQPMGGALRGPTLEEKTAILIAKYILSTTFGGTFIADAIESSAKAICASLPPELHRFAERVALRIAVPVMADSISSHKEIFDVILRAVAESTSIRITIDTNRQGERAEVIFPYILDRDETGDVLLLYFSCKEDAPGVIPIRRIRTAKPGETKFVFPADFDRDEHLRRSKEAK